METLAAEPYRGRADLPRISESLQLELDELLPLCETMQMLRFAELEEGDVRLTEQGNRFVQADTEERKRIFGLALREHVPLVGAIRQVLDERWNHRARGERFRDELEDHMSPDYARETLSTAIGWARYAELFDYDDEADQFLIEEEN